MILKNLKIVMNKSIIILLTVFVSFACGTSKNKSTKTADKETETQVTEEKTPMPITDEEPEIIERPHYNPSATILTDLIHTKLEVSFNWEKSQLNGVATITAKPHFYATDSIILDAKAMEIHDVKIDGKSLGYKYNDAMFLRIGLDKEYTRDEKYTIVIDYTAKPEEKKEGGSSAISSDKGLYFINPTGEDPNKMPQIWTQGETEASSVWFPTIDRPNQKMTQEIFITVKDKYVTLSNGKFIGSKKHKDGTRTDHWKQDLPHVPYLAAMGVGEFKIVKDSYTKPDGTEMPVHYYVEPEWEEHAQAIFGATPEMIGFFSELLGVDFAWDKYHQIVVREYVSGAMENTGAVIFGDFVYKTKRELIDGNDHSIIAHELFHHWFGDLVTCESWANLPLNESFANYSQYLWDEYYNGVDEADYMAEKEAQGYYQSAQQAGHHDMIWYDYDEKEDMFDGHSYNKGGRILHMLRNYLGDEAFFESLKLYLNTHKFKPVEIHHLRLAFEEVSGEDLNWFFDQWFFASYHPELKVTLDTDTPDQAKLTIEQVQDLDKAPLYKLPLKIDVYDNNRKRRYDVVLDKNINEFTFTFKGELQNIVVDAERNLLGSIDFKKPNEYYLHQYYNAPRYKDREEGIKFGSRVRTDAGKQLILDALDDDFWYIRELAIGKLKKLKRQMPDEIYEKLESIVRTDENSRVRAGAVKFLAEEFFDGTYEAKTRSLIGEVIKNDSSYMAVSRALGGLTKGNKSDIKQAVLLAEEMKDEPSSILRSQIAQIYSNHGGKEHLSYFIESLKNGHVTGYEAIGVMGSFTALLKKQDLAVQKEYFGAYKEIAAGGSPYINAVLPMNLGMLKRDLELKANKYNAEVEKYQAEGNQEKADIARFEVEKINDFIDQIDAYLAEISQ